MLKITEQAQEAIASIVADGGAGEGAGLRISGTQSNGPPSLSTHDGSLSNSDRAASTSPAAAAG